jgi:hypothetical protein
MILGTCVMVVAAPAPKVSADEPTPGIEPDFNVSLGETVTKKFDVLLVGHAASTATGAPLPDNCRAATPPAGTDPSFNHTCAAYRIKLDIPGTADEEDDFLATDSTLEITTHWTELANVAGIEDVPDIDTYIFYNPTSEIDASAAGGAEGGQPETITINPEQPEYDLVVNDFAGAVNQISVTVTFNDNNSTKKIAKIPLAKHAPDFVLTPHQAPITKQFTTNIATPPAPVLYPADCRTSEDDNFCDVYRFKLNRTKTKGARNFVVVQIFWQATKIPDVALVALGLGLGYVPDIDAYLYDQPESHMSSGTVGGTGFGIPEKLQWTARQDEFDLEVQATGLVTGYTIKAFMTDELFDTPFELLDDTLDNTKAAPGAFGDENGTLAPDDLSALRGGLDLLPVGSDSDINKVGFGVDQKFGDQSQFAFGPQTRNIANIKPPSAVILWLALVVAPGVIGAFIAVALRRRRRSVLA